MKTILIVIANLLAVLTLVGTGSYFWSTSHPRTTSRSIEIRATPEQVWAVLADNERWAEWNPTLRSRGEIREGATLHNEVRWGDGAMSFSPKVTRVEPGHRLEWLGATFVDGVADGRHGFVIEDLGDGTVRFTQYETFTGALVPFAGRMLDQEQDFEEMNRALKQRVEARVASHG